MDKKKLLSLLLALVLLTALIPLAASADGLADGFYLIGPNGWDEASLSSDDLFVSNPASPGEYMLNTYLSAGTQFKVVKVSSNIITTWYGNTDNYLVTPELAGNVRIYFREAWSSDWGNNYAVFRRFSISAGSCTNGSLSFSEYSAPEDDTVTVYPSPSDGYELDEITVTMDVGGTVPVSAANTFSMPGCDVTVTATFKLKEYQITCTSPTNGSLSADKSKATKDTPVNLTITPDPGYERDEVSYTPYGGTTVPLGDSETFFLMPGADVTVEANFKLKNYTVSCVTPVNGSLSADTATATMGLPINLTVTPDGGYIRGTVTYTPEGGSPVTVSGDSFTMPAANVTVEATFIQEVSAGYYLIGPNWTVNDIDTSDVFTANSTSFQEYYLTTTLTQGQEFKIVHVNASNAIDAWYPSSSGNYVVDANHTGERIIYFRPGGKPDGSWSVYEAQTGNFFYVAPRDQQLTDDSFYLIGPDWEASDIDPADIFVNNPAVSGEYILLTTLASGQQIKVAHVGLNGAITGWYPDAYGSEHTIAGDQAGDRVVYFRTTPQSGWLGSGYFTIVQPCYIKIDPSVSDYLEAKSDYAKASAETAHDGELYTFNGDQTVKLTAAPPEGYRLVSFTVAPDGNYEGLTADIANKKAVFTIKGDVTVSAVFEQIDYSVICSSAENGSVSADKTTAHKGDTVELTVMPASGYKLDSLSYTPEGGAAVTVSGSSFTMPAANVTVKATFKAKPVPTPTPTPTPSPTPTPTTGGGQGWWPAQTTPTPSPTPTASPSPTPTASSAPASTASPDVSVTPAPSPTPGAGGESGSDADGGSGKTTLTDPGAGTGALSSPTRLGTWSLADAILFMSNLALSGGMMYSFSQRKKKKNRALLLPAGAIPAAASLLTLLLTQKFSGAMTVFDKWTPLMAVYMLSDVLLARFSKKPGKKK